MAEVEWSRLTPEGNLQEWQTATPMQQQRWGLATAVDKTYMYALGGLLGAKYLDSVEYTKVSRDNQLAPWHSTAPLDQPRATFSSVIYDGWIYVIGGAYPDGYLASVIYSGHNADGNIGFWGNQSEAAAAAALRAKRAEMARKLRLPNEGIVKDVLQAQAYTYLHLDSDNDGLIWVAGPKLADIKPGDRVGYNQGTPLTGFSSRELQRTFQRIILVGKMQIQ